MIMTSAVEARTHAVAPESIGIHFTCGKPRLDLHCPGMVGTRPVLRIKQDVGMKLYTVVF
jgi:hypothetical protein